MILKKYKNKLFLTLNELGLNIKDFESSDIRGGFRLLHRSSNFKFELMSSPENYHEFEVLLTEFVPGLNENLYPGTSYCAFEVILKYFKTWIESDLNVFLAERTDIDMWEQAKSLGNSSTIEEIDFDDDSPFSDTEKEHVRLGIEETRILFLENKSFNKSQIGLINKRFDYLDKALDRTNKTDWKGIVIGTILGLIMNLGVDTNTGESIWKLVLTIFNNLPSLP